MCLSQWRCAALITGLSGCAYHAYSPPARTLPLESPQVLPSGAQGVSGQAYLAGAAFGPSLLGGALRYRRGVAQDLEGSAEASFFHVTDRDDDVHTWPQVYAARAGLKYQPVSALALSFGLGGGGSAAGGFISPDLGAVVGYENPYVVPFLSGRAFTSQPLGARSIYLGSDDGTPRYSKPQTTYGLGAGIGLRIRFSQDTALSNALLVGAGLTDLFDQGHRESFLSLSLGVDIIL